jgi:valine--pyruvate aminotransferase
MVASGEILTLSDDTVRPYYRAKAERALGRLRSALEAGGDGPDFAIHRPEGALFLWLWLRGLPITCAELYERLKARGVIVVPGHYFFPGLEHDDWPHRHECLRISYAQDDATVERGLAIIAEEARRAYA